MKDTASRLKDSAQETGERELKWNADNIWLELILLLMVS